MPMKTLHIILPFLLGSLVFTMNAETLPLQAQTTGGTLEGVESSGIRIFRGIPYAEPPLGELRWKEPQPLKKWDGVRKAGKFGPAAMQRPLFGDMNFRSAGTSEDCLYLNVWTPAKTGREKLPVLVYFYGGGFMAGDGSELRYDGEALARRGLVTVTVNYRLNIFGFFSHPELTGESPHQSSGNYGLMDQTAALKWVRDNIGAFGGDPAQVTIAGESAGSYSVSAQMASPLARGLFKRAIGSSGSLMGLKPMATLSEGEAKGVEFANAIGAKSLKELRAMPADQLLHFDINGAMPHFPVVIDGYFFPSSPRDIFEKGKQAQVPLLIGWNSEENGYRALLGEGEPTPENFAVAVKKAFPAQADELLKLYPATTPGEVMQAATDLASDRFIGFSSWKLCDAQCRTGHQPVYRYLFAHPRPAMRSEVGNVTAGLAGGIIKQTDSSKPKAPAARGAVHSADIEYAMGNLPTNRVYDWQPGDFAVSALFQSLYENFVKTGNPNGLGVPEWPAFNAEAGKGRLLVIDVETKVKPDTTRDRYQFLDQIK